MIKFVTSVVTAAAVVGAVGLTVAQAQSPNNMPPNKDIEATGAMRPAPSAGTPVTTPSMSGQSSGAQSGSGSSSGNATAAQEMPPQAVRG